MKRISILDCTLRDGGYINQWDFGRKTIADIIRNLNTANIDIIECGFLEDCQYHPDASVFSCVSQIMPLISPKKHGAMYVAMIALGDIQPEQILPYDGTSIDGIRLTFHKHEWEKAKVTAGKLMEKGYQVFIQPVGTTAYTDQELLHLIEDVNCLQPYALYLVDTLGIMYRHDMLRFFYLFDHNLDKNICIGFHSHNNLQLSFSNAQELLRMESTRHIIIDASVYGMGRGVGNLSTELLTEYINVNVQVRYSIMPLLSIADKYLMSIYAQQRWGYDLPYFISAREGCHPNYATFLMNKGTLSMEDISKILSLLPSDKRDLYHAELIGELYINYQNCQIADEDTLALLRQQIQGRKVLLLAPGATLNTYKEEISEYIQRENPYIISVNFVSNDIAENMVFISNRKRAQVMKTALHDTAFIVATSNLMEEMSDNVHLINYSSYIGEGNAADNAGAMLIRILKAVGIASVTLAGFDGYDVNFANNYCIHSYMRQLDQVDAETKNQNIGRQLRLALSGIHYQFITPTKYEV